MTFDLLSEVKRLVGDKGLKPGDYRQTLREANKKRWGKANILRKDGIPIDIVFQEFNGLFPGMFADEEEFVVALARRLEGKAVTFEDPEQELEDAELESYYADDEGIQEALIGVQMTGSKRKATRKYSKKAVELLNSKGLLEVDKTRIGLTTQGIKSILEIALKNRFPAK